MLFESNVNSDSIQTKHSSFNHRIVFESNVNSDSIQTHWVSDEYQH